MKNYSLNTLKKDNFHKTLNIEDRLSLALQSAGFKPAVLPGFSDDFITWQNTKTGEHAVMDGWYGVQDYLEEHINTLEISNLQKEKIKFLIDDKYIHNPHILNSPLKMVDVIAHYEIDNDVPENERLTNWFGDYSMYEPKQGVTGSQIKAKYIELKYPDSAIEREVAPDGEAAALPEDNSSHSPRRYGINKNGESERLWNGKLVEDFTEEERIKFLNDTNALLNNDIPDKKTDPDNNPETQDQDTSNLNAAEISQKEKLQQLNSQIKDLVESYKTNPETIAELLAFKDKFYKYSMNNTMLVYDQNRGATFVQSFDAWKKDGYYVSKGEKGLKVLVPTYVTYLKVPGSDRPIQLSKASKQLQEMYQQGTIESTKKLFYKVGHVFDISQTNVPAEKYPEYYSMGYKNDDYEKIISGISKYSQEKLNCPVETADLKSISLKGVFYPGKNIINLNERLESSERLSVLSHELGHAIMHNVPDLSQMNPNQVEFEADCMSIMLQSHFGITLTDARKEHISQHYKSLENALNHEDKVLDFNGIMNNVFSKYENVIEDINRYVENEINHEQQLGNTLSEESVLQENVLLEKMAALDFTPVKNTIFTDNFLFFENQKTGEQIGFDSWKPVSEYLLGNADPTVKDFGGAYQDSSIDFFKLKAADSAVVIDHLSDQTIKQLPEEQSMELINQFIGEKYNIEGVLKNSTEAKDYSSEEIESLKLQRDKYSYLADRIDNLSADNEQQLEDDYIPSGNFATRMLEDSISSDEVFAKKNGFDSYEDMRSEGFYEDNGSVNYNMYSSICDTPSLIAGNDIPPFFDKDFSFDV